MSLLNRLPPLNALRAFEVVARHLSFARAAEELHVTKACGRPAGARARAGSLAQGSSSETAADFS